MEPLTLIGAPPSPYTRKMIALMRYRHIPYNIIWGDPQSLLSGEFKNLGIDPPKPVLLPTFILPDEKGILKAETDSTPLIRRFEVEYEDRKCLPGDPALNFLNFLLEDFADEWVTKFMFHYRWHFNEDADNAGTLLPLAQTTNLPDEIHQSAKKYISERQIERLRVVGSNDTTAPIIEASYKRFLSILEKHFKNSPFLLGQRASSADFGLYGQLSQLIGFDPTSRKIAHDLSPRTVAWINVIEDLSGLEITEEGWTKLEELPESIFDLLTEVGRGYVPALLTNKAAHEKGEKTWEAEIDGCLWVQQTFPYQSKCLKWINEEYLKLSKMDKSRIDNVLKDTGCEILFIK